MRGISTPIWPPIRFVRGPSKRAVKPGIVRAFSKRCVAYSSSRLDSGLSDFEPEETLCAHRSPASPALLCLCAAASHRPSKILPNSHHPNRLRAMADRKSIAGHRRKLWPPAKRWLLVPHAPSPHPGVPKPAPALLPKASRWHAGLNMARAAPADRMGLPVKTAASLNRPIELPVC